MQPRTLQIATAFQAALIVAGTLACTAPAPGAKPPSSPEAKAAAERSWTREFQEESILIAREVSIEGPPGLREHVAYMQMPDQKYSAKTTADGFLQEISVEEGAPNPIWIHIDHLAINAVHGARVLERVGPGPVRIHALGDALWKNLVTGQEQRAETLDLVGPPAQ